MASSTSDARLRGEQHPRHWTPWRGSEEQGNERKEAARDLPRCYSRTRKEAARDPKPGAARGQRRGRGKNVQLEARVTRTSGFARMTELLITSTKMGMEGVLPPFSNYKSFQEFWKNIFNFNQNYREKY